MLETVAKKVQKKARKKAEKVQEKVPKKVRKSPKAGWLTLVSLLPEFSKKLRNLEETPGCHRILLHVLLLRFSFVFLMSPYSYYTRIKLIGMVIVIRARFAISGNKRTYAGLRTKCRICPKPD